MLLSAATTTTVWQKKNWNHLKCQCNYTLNSKKHYYFKTMYFWYFCKQQRSILYKQLSRNMIYAIFDCLESAIVIRAAPRRDSTTDPCCDRRIGQAAIIGILSFIFPRKALQIIEIDGIIIFQTHCILFPLN